jgi:hypothetical protein
VELAEVFADVAADIVSRTELIAELVVDVLI